MTDIDIVKTDDTPEDNPVIEDNLVREDTLESYPPEPLTPEPLTPESLTTEPVVVTQKRSLWPFLATFLLASLLGAAGGWALVKADRAQNPVQVATQSDLQALTTRLAAVESSDDLNSLDARLETLESRPAPRAALGGIDLAELQTRVSRLESDRDTRTLAAPPAGNSILPTTLADIERRLAALESARKSASSTPRSTLPLPTVAVTSRPTTAEATPTTATPTTDNTATANTATATANTAISTPVKATTPPTFPALPDFPHAAVRDALTPERPRLLSRVIRVRDVQSEDTLLTVQDALAAGDLATARAAFVTLPDTAQAAARDWKDAIDARLRYSAGQ